MLPCRCLCHRNDKPKKPRMQQLRDTSVQKRQEAVHGTDMCCTVQRRLPQRIALVCISSSRHRPKGEEGNSEAVRTSWVSETRSGLCHGGICFSMFQLSWATSPAARRSTTMFAWLPSQAACSEVCWA